MSTHFSIPKKYLFLLYLGYVFFLSACGQAIEHSKYIPQEASYVFCLNMESIDSKTQEWPSLISRDLMQMMGGVKNTYNLQEYLATSGIDKKSPVYIFGEGAKSERGSYLALSFKISNESTFDAFLRNFPEQKLNIRSFSGIRYTILDNKTILGWMNRVALFITRDEKTDEESLKNHLLKLRDLPKKRSLIVHNAQGQSLLKNPEFDFGAWFNLEQYEKDIKNSLKGLPLPINIDLKDNFLNLKVSFEQGLAIADVEFFNLNSSLIDYRNIVKEEISEEIIELIPVDTPLGVMGLGLNMEGIKELFNNLGGNLFSKQIKKFSGLEPNEMMDMLSGDFLGVLKDIKRDSTQNFANYEYLLGIGIEDDSALSTMLNTLQKDAYIYPRDSAFYTPQANLHLIEQNSILYITSSDSIKKELLYGQISFNNPASQIPRENFLSVFGNVEEGTRQKLPSTLFGEDRFTEGLVKFTRTPIESVSFSIKAFKNEVSTSQIIFYFKNKQDNALKSLSNSVETKTSIGPS